MQARAYQPQISPKWIAEDGKSFPLSTSLLAQSAADGSWKVEALTDKGRQLLADAGDAIVDGEAKGEKIADLPKKFDIEAVKPWLDANFQSDVWKELAFACIGCGACINT